MTDRIVIFYGSKKDFEELVATETSKEQVTIPFMELIQHYNARLRPNESGVRESALSRNIDVDNCVVRADDYGSVLEHVLSNFVNVVTLNHDIGTLFVHNPPRKVRDSLRSAYVDTNYDVNLGQAIFLLTCNFGSEEEIKKILGPAMFSRIGCCIAYEELSTEQKQTIVHNWYESILSVLKADEKEEIEKTDILDWFIKNAERYDNIRILKTKLENAIFDRLSEVFIIS